MLKNILKKLKNPPIVIDEMTIGQENAQAYKILKVFSPVVIVILQFFINKEIMIQLVDKSYSVGIMMFLYVGFLTFFVTYLLTSYLFVRINFFNFSFLQ